MSDRIIFVILVVLVSLGWELVGLVEAVFSRKSEPPPHPRGRCRACRVLLALPGAPAANLAAGGWDPDPKDPTLCRNCGWRGRV